MATDRYTAQQVAAALTAAKGFVSVAAKNLQCSDQTVRNYMERYAMCKQAVTDARESMIDIAEGRLYQNINSGDNTAIIFFLKTQAKHRGYIERYEQRTEISGPNGDDIPIRVVDYRHGLATVAPGSDEDSE
jgi:hypothetical protein